MRLIRPLAMATACCLFVGVSLTAQTGTPAIAPANTTTYFQGVIKDARTRIREIGVERLAADQKAHLSQVLVDVREDNEWDKGRIPGAIHVGRGVLEVSIEARIPQKSTAIVVYCRSGGRSAVSADVLSKMGYTNVSSLAGGVTAWEAAGLPLDKPNPPK
jgi:rhodanese-related sulfurtransferase